MDMFDVPGRATLDRAAPLLGEHDQQESAVHERHHVEIRSAPDCPLVDQVRATLDRALARTSARARIDELVGDHPSPTPVIDGRDVTGRPPGQSPCCRLDLPSEDDVLAALAR